MATFEVPKFLLGTGEACGIFAVMSTLAEIEEAAGSLFREDKEVLLRFLAMRLRKERALPEPRRHADDEIAAMLSEDETDGTRLREEA